MLFIIGDTSSTVSTLTTKRHNIKTTSKKRKLTNTNKDSLDFTLFGNNIVQQELVARRLNKPILYAFPSFDKCDSLLYFPSTFTRHLNSSDFKSLSKLFSNYLDKNCDIDMLRIPIKPTVTNFTAFLEATNDLHPDTTMCVHTTKVVENQIRATIYSKFTECRAIYTAMQRTVQSEVQESLMKAAHPDNIKARLDKQDLTEEFKDNVVSLIEKGDDVVVYVKCDMVLTLDELSKKVVSLMFDVTLTDVRSLDFNH